VGKYVVVAVVCVVAGFVGAVLTGRVGEPDARAPTQPAEEPRVAPAHEIQVLRQEIERLTAELARREGPASGPAADEGEGGSAVKAMLPPDASKARIAQAERLVRQYRAQSLLNARNAEATAARRVAEEMEAERRFLEDKARGGVMAMLRGLREKPAHLVDLVSSPGRFGKLFVQHVTGPTLAGYQLADVVPLPDGSVVALAAGVHSWDVAGYRSHKKFPKDLFFRGAGMDRTLLRLNELDTRDEIHSLTFQDLTIDCSGDYMTDLRSRNPVTIRLVRCRVANFDMAAGGSVMLGADTAAFLAEDSRFEAGLGHRAVPGSGNLFRVRSGLLVRLAGCVVRGPFSSVYDSDDQATYVFSKCSFEDMAPRLRGRLESPPAGVRMEECTFSYLEDGYSRKRGERPFTEINPDWKR